METPGPTSGTTPVTTASTAADAARWRVGQLLQATVLESQAGKVLLAIGNRQVSSETSLPLNQGQQLTVLVRSLGELPVLRITSALNLAPLTEAVRALLPRQDSMAPLLASLARLAQTAQPPIPPLIRELTRAMVNHLPDAAAVARPEGLRKAIEQSGLFLERQLAQQLNPAARTPSNPAPVSAIQQDFKANLLQLIQRLQNWPGSTPTPAPASGTASRATTVAPGGNPPPPAPATTGQASQPPPATTPTGGPGVTAQPTNYPAATPAQNADALRRVVQAEIRPTVSADARPAPTAPGSGPGVTPPPTTAPTGGAPATPATPLPPGTVPPPFPGAAPAPQAAAQVTLDLLNRIGNLRTDLLRQAEAALARIQLHQLASQPREADRSLLEWLLELPVRRDNEIDIWSMRIAREARDGAQAQAATHRWSVQLAFDLPGLGPVQARVTLSGEQVSTRFWTGKEDALPLFREHLGELQHMFRNAGLDVGTLDCLPGPMPGRAAAPSLIREKA